MIESAKILSAAIMMTIAFLALRTNTPLSDALIHIFLCAYGAFFLLLYYSAKNKLDKTDETWRNRMESVYQELEMCRRRAEMLERSAMPRIPDMPNLQPLTTQPTPAAEPIRITDELIAELDKRYITLAQADKRYQKVSKLERILTPTKENQMEE